MPSFTGITHISLEISSHRVFYGVESWSGVLEMSIGVEYRSGVGSNFVVAKVLALCS